MENEKVTIIVVHRGNQSYLRDSLRCARNAGNHVVLIGDESNSKDQQWVDFRTCQSGNYEHFVDIYQHMSSNPYKFELICFERYFLTHSYMKQHKLTECVMMDSDICLFDQITKENFEYADLAILVPEQKTEYSLSASAHFSYWTIDALEKMLSFLIQSYESIPEEMTKKWEWHQRTGAPGGICDMTLLYLFSKSYRGKILNTDKIMKPKMFDQIMSETVSHGIEFAAMKNRDTKAVFKNEKGQMCYRSVEGVYYPVLYIHAQGGDKRYIYPISRKRTSIFWIEIGNLRYWLKRIYEKCMRTIGIEKRFNWK